MNGLQLFIFVMSIILAACAPVDQHGTIGQLRTQQIEITEEEISGGLDEAIAGTRRGSPDLSLYHQRKAYVAQAQGDQPAQLESMKKAHQCSRKNAVVACELADLAEELEDWDLAAQTLRTIATLDGDCPITPAQSLIRQGRIALRQDDKKRALLCARRAKMADSESEELAAFLQELGEE